ncbi:MAG TPA: hypothetical protein VHY30_02990 [Verrucomicrobiae bacterium]|jgi:hypothetical protein|nr:hypothetical protein [Verrucomicrobiae bacterium]
MTRQQILDLYFLDARHKLIELAAFLDRVERADSPSSPSASTRQAKDDFRLKTFRAALGELNGNKKGKAKKVLLAFSDLTTEPIAKAAGKGATGAYCPQISQIRADKFSARQNLRKSA